MTVRAKMCLSSIASYGYEGRELRFSTQYSPEIPEDQRFAKASPSGDMRIMVDNPAALAMFEGKIGKAFYLDMVEVPPDPPKQP
jgi:hypothetical protein